MGLRTAKREKCSIFNFLEFPSHAAEDDENTEEGGKEKAELVKGVVILFLMFIHSLRLFL